ncbi:TraI domain-containing protein [Xenorhabdus griffiniae]|uniref:TraI domain-containing protein n=1 Tax=Xenorhabdus griffiniae TaxID=351672 RepID=A0ABY9XEQ9_9GAMM|nr:TraI domain-containing protein [Xenorhabdus griffiniae]MBD1226032.1 TraI domain-containing protein [Xenorhabdus griffiniae]MBE8585850.1 TraI domain-containing protein [Xenorhabdus griffiniae]WMV71397.1 TraI domain-containing protein [Xenorhabdus griffiniae]WNH01073.1 TraI domain-containing protein [Xenorhabdus griffiniae]
MKIFKKWLNSSFDVSGGNKSKSEIPVAPDGYFLPKKSCDLFNTTLRKNCLQQLWENASLSKAQYQEFFLFPLSSAAERIQNLPAFNRGIFALEGGLLDLTLLTMVYSVRLSKKKLLPTGALPEEQSSQSSAWNAVVFYASMFHWLPLMGQFDGEYIDQTCWMPGVVTPNKAYRFRSKPNSSNLEELRSVSGALMSYTLLPEKVIYWLSETPVALQALMHCMVGKWEGGRDVSNLIDEAVNKLPNINDVIGKNINNSVLEPTENISIIPPTQSAIYTQSDANKIQEETQSLDIVSLKSAFNETTSQKEELSETAFVVNTKEAISDDLKTAMSLLDIKEEEVAQKEQDNCVDSSSLNSLKNQHVEHELPNGESKIRNNSLAENKSVEIIEENVFLKGREEKDTEEAHIRMDGQEQGKNEPLKVKFWQWLKQGLQAEKIEYNTASAKVHCVAGFVFLQTPAIFFLFLRQHPELEIDHKQLLSAFESLNVHRVEKKGNRRKRHYTCKIYPVPVTEEACKNNKFLRASGYLVKMSLIFSEFTPDSLFVDFSSE